MSNIPLLLVFKLKTRGSQFDTVVDPSLFEDRSVIVSDIIHELEREMDPEDSFLDRAIQEAALSLVPSTTSAAASSDAGALLLMNTHRINRDTTSSEIDEEEAEAEEITRNRSGSYVAGEGIDEQDLIIDRIHSHHGDVHG